MRHRAAVVAGAIAMLLAAITPLPAAAQAPEVGGLTRMLEAEMARFPGRSGVYVKHLTTGEEAVVRADEVFEAASTIKLGAALLAFHLADEGLLDLDARYEIQPADLRSGGLIGAIDPGYRPTFRDLITQMIIVSDNAAADIVIRRVGGKERINAFFAAHGFASLRQVRTTFEVFRWQYEQIDPKFATLTPEDVFVLSGVPTISGRPEPTERQRQLVDEVRKARAERRAAPGTAPQILFGAASPRDMGRLLEGVERGTLVSRNASGTIKRILLAQQLGNRKIPYYLNLRVGHKTGESSDITNDVGIIYARSGPIVMAYYNNGYTGLAGEADERIGRIARRVVDYFDGPR